MLLCNLDLPCGRTWDTLRDRDVSREAIRKWDHWDEDAIPSPRRMHRRTTATDGTRRVQKKRGRPEKI